MRSLPYFLALLAFLASIVGCQATTAPATPKVAHAAPSAVATRPPAPSPKSEDPPIGSLYNDLQDGPFGRYLRGEPEPTERRQVEFLCVVTGEFNVAPDGQQLLMEKWCVEAVPPGNGGIAMMQVEDTKVDRMPGKHVFRIMFRDAVVSVQDLGAGKREVRLHYRDPNGVFHHVDLTPRTGEKYEYSFADLSPDTVEPLGESSTMEVQIQR